MTFTRRAVRAAMAGALGAVLGLAGCSSQSADSGAPPLYKKWDPLLEAAFTAVHDNCGISMVGCPPKVRDLMSRLAELRRDIQADPRPDRYADVVPALDQADTDYQRFTGQYGCEVATTQENCKLMIVTIEQDVTNIINKVNGHG
jgi:hypothetical protein